MGREAKLREKNGHWYTAAGGGRYFGRRDVVSYANARKAFLDFLKLGERMAAKGLTVMSLCKQYVDWLRKNRSERTVDERKRHLEFWCNFRVGENRLGDLGATEVAGQDLEQMIAVLTEGMDERKAVDPFTADKYATSVKAAFNWGRKHPAPITLLPSEFRPFASVEKYKRPLTVMSDVKLPKLEEIDALFGFADADLATVLVEGKWREREPKDYRVGDNNPYQGFGDLLKVYHATGARTSELATAKVGDYFPVSRQIVLGTHKRSKKQKDATARQITLNQEASAIVERWCEGKDRDLPIFTDPKGRAWTRYTLDNRFAAVRKRAGVRKAITLYSFRHLWISEAVMAGTDLATIARMAGTSIAMIEKVYGHLRADHLWEVQARIDAERARKREASQPPGPTAA